MSRKVINFLLTVCLALTVVFFTTSCEKLKYSNLMANHHFNKANSHFTENLFRKAIEEYEKALKYNPRLIQAYRFLGESYKSLYKPGIETEDNVMKADKALEALNKALEIDSRNKEIIHSLGDLYDKMRDFKKAEEMFLRILEMEPTNMENYYVVAGFYKRYSGDNEELGKRAEQMYLRRIETDPENPEGYSHVSQFYDDISPTPEFDKSCAFHQKRLMLDPNNSLIYYTIGVNRFQKAYRLQNVLSRPARESLADESEQALLKAIDLDPSYAFSYAYINMLYRNVHANLYPDRHDRYVAEADRWQEKFKDMRKRELERERLEEELRRGRVE
jgi:tetratricopeptide (TPR) repeat protein